MKKLKTDNYIIGRTTYRRFGRQFTAVLHRWLAAFGSFFADSTPGRWLAQKRPVRMVAGVILLIHGLGAIHVWRPLKHGFGRMRRYLGRNEVWAHLLVWGVCAFMGLVIALSWDRFDPSYIKLISGVIILVAFTLICFRSPMAGLLGWLVTAPVLKAVIHFKLVEGLPLVTGDGSALLILIAAYIFHSKRDSLGEPTRLLHLCMGLFIIGELIAAYHTEMPKRSAQMVVDQYMFPIFVYLFARRWITDKRALGLVFAAIMFIGAYFVVFAIPEHFTGRNFFQPYGHSAYIEWELGTVRAQGPAADPQEFGLVLTLVACTAMVFSSYDKRRWMRYLSIIIMVMAFVGIAYTLRRSVYVGAFIALIVMLGSSAKSRRSTFATLAIIAVVLVAGWGHLRQTKVFSERLAEMEPLYRRAVVQATAINIVKHNPWFGLGFDRYGEGNRKYLVGYKDILPEYGKGFHSPHSSYLRIMVDGGMVAFVPFCLMVLMILVVSFRAYKRAQGSGLMGKDAFFVFWGFSVGVLVQASSTDSFFHNKYLIALWMFYFGALLGVHLRSAPKAAVVTTRNGPRLPAGSQTDLVRN